MFNLDDIIDFMRRNLFLLIGLTVFLYRIYGQYVETSKKAEIENQRKRELAQRQERADGYEGYLDRTTATNLDDGRDDFSQTGRHNGPRPTTQDTRGLDTRGTVARGFDDLARDLQQARTQTTQTFDPQSELRRLLNEKMGRAPKTVNQPNTTPNIGRPSSNPQPTARRPVTTNAFEPDRTAASTFKPSSVTAPSSLEQNRVIEASFERSLVRGGNDPFAIPEATSTSRVSGSSFSSKDAVRAVIWNEILGAPKSRHR